MLQSQTIQEKGTFACPLELSTLSQTPRADQHKCALTACYTFTASLTLGCPGSLLLGHFAKWTILGIPHLLSNPFFQLVVVVVRYVLDLGYIVFNSLLDDRSSNLHADLSHVSNIWQQCSIRILQGRRLCCKCFDCTDEQSRSEKLHSTQYGA